MPNATAFGGKSFLRWAGSKRKILDTLAAKFDGSHPLYVEPFAGSAVLYFRIAPSQAILSDLNGQLVNSLRAVRDFPEDIYSDVRRIPRTKEDFYKVRANFNKRRASSYRKAVQFIYLNRNCFNGLWRTDTGGQFNVPFGGDRTGAYPSRQIFQSCSTMLKTASLRHCDFRAALRQAERKDAFVYLDPPYFTSNERVFVEYGKRTFGEADLKDLLDSLPTLNRSGAHFLLSYRYDEEVIKRCSRWNITVMNVMRNVAGFSSNRRVERELLISNR